MRRAPGRQCASNSGGHQGTGVQAHRAARENIASAHGDQIGGSGSRADEMDGHGEMSPSASAQVTGPTAMRGASNRAWGPAAASAAASATECTFMAAIDRAERVSVREFAASSRGCGINCSSTPRAAAAARSPASAPLTAGAAIRPSRSRPAHGAAEPPAGRPPPVPPRWPCGSRCRRRSRFHPSPLHDGPGGAPARHARMLAAHRCRRGKSRFA